VIIFTFLAGPFQWLLEHLTDAFSSMGPLRSIGAFGIAVVVLTILIRAVLFPVFSWQLHNSRRIQQEQRLVAPQMQELRKKYKKEPQKLSAEMNKVYREHGISPLSPLTGCLPALVQMPVLIGLYTAIRNVTNSALLGSVGKGFLWIPDVTKSAHDVVSGNWALLLTHPQLLILPAIAGLFTFAQTRMMMQPPRPDMSDQERSMANVSKQMSFIFPVMIFVFGLILPQALAIYWVTGTVFMVLQQWIVVGWGGLHVPVWFPGARRVTKLSFNAPLSGVRPTLAPRGAAALAAPAQPRAAAKNGKNSESDPSGNGSSPAAPRTQTAQRALARSAARSRGNPRRRRRR